MKKITVAGILILVSFSVLFRGLFFPHETYGFLAALTLLSVLYFVSKIRNDEPVLVNRLFVIPGIILVISTAVSFVNAANPRENLGTLLLHSELIVVFTVLYDYFYGKKLQFARYLMMLVTAAGFVCAMVGLTAMTGRFNALEATVFFGRLGSTFQYANTASIYFVICLVFSITIANTDKNMLLCSIAAGMSSIFAYAFFMTGSRGGYLVITFIIPLLLLVLPSEKWIRTAICLISAAAPVFITQQRFTSAVEQHSVSGAVVSLAASFIIAAVIYILLFSVYRVIAKGRKFTAPKGTRLLLGCVLAIVLVLVAVFRGDLVKLLPDILADRLGRLIAEGINDVNVLIRLNYYKDALKLISSNWLTGLGGGGWKASYQIVQDYPYIANYAHNHYLQVFVENGVLGFLSFCAMALISVYGLIISYIHIKDATVRTYVTGLLCGLVSLIVHAAADFDLSFISMMLLLFTMYAAAMTGVTNTGMNVSLQGTKITGNIYNLALTIISSVLFSFHALFFAGAYNQNAGLKYFQKKDYRAALVFYEEARRFDSSNPAYSFELAKLYHYFGKRSRNEDDRRLWFEKALEAGERSVAGNKNYPAYMKTFVMICLDSDMPLKALETAEKLLYCQKYNAEVYELLARSYIDAATHYVKNGNTAMARELLGRCIAIDHDPNLRRSVAKKPGDADLPEVLAEYRHSEELAGFLSEAERYLERLE